MNVYYAIAAAIWWDVIDYFRGHHACPGWVSFGLTLIMPVGAIALFGTALWV